jgi:hypothetical protein
MGTLLCTPPSSTLTTATLVSVSVPKSRRSYSVDLKNSPASCYQAPSAKFKADPSIQPDGGILTIGYGLREVWPFGHGLTEQQDIVVGYLKIFLSDHEVDLSSLPQLIPSNEGSRGAKRPVKHPDVWHTILLTVVQRRYPPLNSFEV